MADIIRQSLSIAVNEIRVAFIFGSIASGNEGNMSDYEMIGVVSDQELEEMIALAHELQKMVTVWLRKDHPELPGD